MLYNLLGEIVGQSKQISKETKVVQRQCIHEISDFNVMLKLNLNFKLNLNQIRKYHICLHAPGANLAKIC